MAGTAGAGAATSSAFPPPPPLPSNSRISPYTLPSSFPPRERRTNHLRKKILKTLENKPYPDPSNPQFPLTIHTIPTQDSSNPHLAESDQGYQAESTDFVEGILGTFKDKSFAKIGLYLVGAFVFQTICAVLIFGSKGSKDLDDLDDKDENLISKGSKTVKILEPKTEPESGFLSSGNSGFVEMKEGRIGSEMDDRIMEIQEMARRAREQERMEAKGRGLGEEESDDVEFDSVDEMVKKKEIDDRLTKLRKSLEGDYQKPAAKIPIKGNNVDDEGLMFKKKYKYKSPSVDTGDKPKGFGGMKDVHVANGTAVSGVNVDGILQTDENNGGMLSKDENKEQEARASMTESIAGTSKEPKYDKQTNKAEKSGISTNLGAKKPRGFGKESNGTAKHDDFNKNDSLKGKKGGTKKSTRNLENKSSTQTGFWWTRIPYVMAVGMQSGANGEESSGLFIIRNASGLHHTVAFEDRSDATNFCYLLESFFEDLNNFSTTIVPIPTNELEVEVKSQKMKVVVVKKGQLKLYVGQPLEDVEAALRVLIDQQSE